MNTIIKFLSLIYLLLFMTSCNKNPEGPEGQKIKISTSEGNIYVVLYDDTPIHKQNFIDNVNSEAYVGAPFHRVIEDFMIQAGETSKKRKEKSLLQAEIAFPKHLHKRGSLAAARTGDEVNPEKKSDPYEFYIVTGDTMTQEDLVLMEKERFEELKQDIYKELQPTMNDSIKVLYKEGRKDEIMALRASTVEEANKIAQSRKNEVTYTDEQRQYYMEVGGTPHLDLEYTVFGEVYYGMEIAQKISEVETNYNDRPLKKVTINNVELLKD